MVTNTMESELVGLERKYWQAIQDQDLDAALALTEFPCMVAGARGVAKVEREAFVQMMQGANYVLNSFTLKNEQVRMLRDDVAIVAYTVSEDLTVDGKPVKLEAHDASTWVKRDGRWRCALHTESPNGDSFGRDRKSD